MERLDAIVTESQLDTEFLSLAMHGEGFHPAKETAKPLASSPSSASWLAGATPETAASLATKTFSLLKVLA